MFVATGLIGYFYLLIVILGFGAIALVGLFTIAAVYTFLMPILGVIGARVSNPDVGRAFRTIHTGVGYDAAVVKEVERRASMKSARVRTERKAGRPSSMSLMTMPFASWASMRPVRIWPPFVFTI